MFLLGIYTFSYILLALCELQFKNITTKNSLLLLSGEQQRKKKNEKYRQTEIFVSFQWANYADGMTNVYNDLFQTLGKWYFIATLNCMTNRRKSNVIHEK